MRHLKYVRKDKSFHDYIVYDILGILTGITSKAMFGGWAIYNGGTIFGINKRIAMSYWLVPEEIIEDREKLVVLIEQSVAVSRYIKMSKK